MAALRRVEGHLVAGEEIDEGALVRDLGLIRQIDPDALNTLVDGLNEVLPEMGRTVRRIVDDL